MKLLESSDIAVVSGGFVQEEYRFLLVVDYAVLGAIVGAVVGTVVGGADPNNNLRLSLYVGAAVAGLYQTLRLTAKLVDNYYFPKDPAA